MIRYIVTTSEFEKGLLMQRIDLEGPGDVRQTILQQVLDTTEAQVRAALIKLGWTPPEAMGALDIPRLDGGYRRVTGTEVIKMEEQIRQIADALHL